MLFRDMAEIIRKKQLKLEHVVSRMGNGTRHRMPVFLYKLFSLIFLTIDIYHYDKNKYILNF